MGTGNNAGEVHAPALGFSSKPWTCTPPGPVHGRQPHPAQHPGVLSCQPGPEPHAARPLQASGREENIVGWYHSHPGYGCWLSGIDVGTQLTNQKYQEPFLAIVVDPHRTEAAGKVELGAFRTYPEVCVLRSAPLSRARLLVRMKSQSFVVFSPRSSLVCSGCTWYTHTNPSPTPLSIPRRASLHPTGVQGT